ncbi:2-phospho-L-lactate guanylyltransferase [Arthrobacter sp. Marseille-P9274]|uniref:2-phospho-L-lactate guanylyltransferase n=1 Tax=Arthrobacter sp. Marseille-P9274 TaxID=2866572 RepID=UPI0021C7F941|nr:2-phospho-L-lactate guanylyltransferase [Arthrobacter sp. Marseille-P9274]
MPLTRTSRAPVGPWTLVVPFKGGPEAKSRLGHASQASPGLRPDVRSRLALAFLSDTVAAARAVPEVADIVIVSSDAALLTAIPDIILVADPGQGLNAAVTAGIEWASAQVPNRPMAALTGDLPCLLPHDLAAGLAAAREHPRSLVADRHGTGTTLLTALPGQKLIPRFGTGSCHAHTRAGHALLPIPGASTLRLDVDSVEDLNTALRRGTGHHTRSTMLRPPPRAYGARLSDNHPPLIAAAVRSARLAASVLPVP